LEVKLQILWNISQLKSQSVLLTTCIYFNTSAVALDEVNGYRYGIEKPQKNFGHHIVLTPISGIIEK
jgi:hypothetical protein